jgi:hypothetical protein
MQPAKNTNIRLTSHCVPTLLLVFQIEAICKLMSILFHVQLVHRCLECDATFTFRTGLQHNTQSIRVLSLKQIHRTHQTAFVNSVVAQRSS